MKFKILKIKVKFNDERTGSHLCVIYPLNCEQPTFIESRKIKNIIARIVYHIHHKNVSSRGHAYTVLRTRDTNQPRRFARSSIYTSSVEFRLAIPDPEELRTRPKAKHGEKTCDGARAPF